MRNQKIVLVLKSDSHSKNASVGQLCNLWPIQLYKKCVAPLNLSRNALGQAANLFAIRVAPDFFVLWQRDIRRWYASILSMSPFNTQH